MKFHNGAIICLTVIALGYGSICPAEGGKKPGKRGHPHPDSPQAFVVCTGWHALCTESLDCRLNGDMADCNCMRVNEAHIVATAEIQDPAVKHRTEVKCTDAHPCGTDQAPVCAAIRDGTYLEGVVRYDWVSTYSYRGWCTLMQQNLVACDPTAPDYHGDSHYAICDVAPCTENPSPADPRKPLICQCRAVKDEAFVGMNGSCTGVNGGIMSSMPTWAWDFQNNTYPFPMPGYEYVQGACAPVGSDPWKKPRCESESRRKVYPAYQRDRVD